MSDSLNELFNRDPLDLSKEDLDTVVEALRAQRKNFDLGIKPTKAAKPKATSAKAKKAATGDLDLADLGLDEPPAKPAKKTKEEAANISLDDLGL